MWTRSGRSVAGEVFQNTNGYDIIFTDVTGATQLDHEIESYNPATGRVVAWVRIPTLSSTADSAIYMWYGNSSVTTSQSNPAGVWKGYQNVYHLANVAGPSTPDSSGNGNGLIRNVAATSGQLGGAGQFNGTSSYLQIPARPNGGNFGSFEVWLKTTSTGIVVGDTDGTLPNGTPATDGWTALLYLETGN